MGKVNGIAKENEKASGKAGEITLQIVF